MKNDIASNSFHKLFQVKIHHRYFLDVDDQPFESPAPDETDTARALREAAYKNYDVSSFLRIEPSRITRETMRRHHLLFRPTAKGFWVLTEGDQQAGGEVKMGWPLPTDINSPAASLTFLLYLTDPYFINYTEVNMEQLQMLRTYDAASGELQRGVFIFETAANSNRLDIGGSEQLNLGETWNTSFEGDTPALPLALIRIHCAHLLTAGGSVGDNEFELVLRNRSTLWEYRGPLLSTPYRLGSPRPLVRHNTIPFEFSGPPTLMLPLPTPAATSLETPAAGSLYDTFVSVSY